MKESYSVPVMRFEGDNYVVSTVDFDAAGMRFETDEVETKARFIEACFNFEQLHGKPAANDFRNTVPPSSGGAIIHEHPGVSTCRGAKESRQGPSPCVAPSVDNARIGASLL